MTSSPTRGGVPVRALLRGAALTRAGRPIVVAVLVAVLGAAALLGTAACTAPGSAAPPGPPALAVVPTRSDPPATRSAPPLLTAVPAAGTVSVEPGPFTDRVSVTALALQSGERPVVTGRIAVTTDVSELIVLTLQVDFYDIAGRYLGSGRVSYADEEFADNGAIVVEHTTGPHDEAFQVAVPSTDPIAGAASAVLTVAQLVNE